METLPIFLGAFALQAGLYAIFAGYVLLSAVLFAGGAAMWTRSSIAKGAYRPQEEANLRYSLLNVVLVLVLATSLSAWQVGTDAETGGDSATPGLVPNTRRVMRRLTHASRVKHQAPKQSVTRVFAPKEQRGAPGKDGPGLVLRYEMGSRRKTLSVIGHFSLSQPLTIPLHGRISSLPNGIRAIAATFSGENGDSA